jgi:hypothetical protein
MVIPFPFFMPSFEKYEKELAIDAIQLTTTENASWLK